MAKRDFSSKLVSGIAKSTWDRKAYRAKQTAERRRRGRTRKFRRQMSAQTKKLHGEEKYQKAVAAGREKSSIAQLREKGYVIAAPRGGARLFPNLGSENASRRT